MTRVYDRLSHDFVYHDLSKMMIFVANHDTDRIGDIVRKTPDRLKLSMAMLALRCAASRRYFGDEMMFTSSKDLAQDTAGCARGFRRLGATFEPAWTRAARCGTGRLFDYNAAALPMAQVEARDPQRPHDALPLARQHLRLFPL